MLGHIYREALDMYVCVYIDNTLRSVRKRSAVTVALPKCTLTVEFALSTRVLHGCLLITVVFVFTLVMFGVIYSAICKSL